MTGTTLRVLLIEDDEDDFILTSDLLNEVEGTKYEITWVSKYSDALPAICSGTHDICLIDYRLGEGNGIQLVREAIAADCLVPMILLTGQGGHEIDIEATRAGAADYLIKGQIESLLLERAIRYALARGKMLETLRESENRFRSVVESANDAIILTDQSGKISAWNNGAQKTFGYSREDILGQSLSFLFPKRYYEYLENDGITDPLISSEMLHTNGKTSEYNGLKKDGTEFPLEISLSSWETAKGLFYSGIIRDVTERKSLEDQLTHQALHDPLTKLANRVLFRDRVEHSLTRVGRKKAPVAVLFLDLDNFKNINDSLGHAAGDQLLISVAERLQACLRSSDTAARLGGDEFAILVEDSNDTNGALLVAERIRDILRTPFSIAGKEIAVGTSIGIASAQTGKESPEELLRNADVAMYMAKTQGKGCFTVFETQMHEALVMRVELEDDMRRAIERNEFEVYYQPIVDLQSGTVMGMEALARWNHPTRGMVMPNDFIPLAEETKLIIPIGRYILEEACRQTRLWQDRNESGSLLSITVNISGCQFQDDSLPTTVSEVLATTGLNPNSLILEITENTMLQNTDASVKKLEGMKSLGVRLAIDDFGTGYSSLSYLQRFPIDILKIDQSFIDKISQGKEGAAVARAIITMSDTLRLRTIAEGIETHAQTVALQDFGCELGQGFHFAKPLNHEDMGKFLLNSQSAEETAMPVRQPHFAETLEVL